MRHNTLCLLILVFSILAINQSCTSIDQMCTDKVVGIYSGNTNCSGTDRDMLVEITKINHTDLNIIWTTSLGAVIPLTGTLSSDCKSIQVNSSAFESNNITFDIKPVTWIIGENTLIGKTIVEGTQLSICDFKITSSVDKKLN